MKNMREIEREREKQKIKDVGLFGHQTSNFVDFLLTFC
jgi:hypothetical protein